MGGVAYFELLELQYYNEQKFKFNRTIGYSFVHKIKIHQILYVVDDFVKEANNILNLLEIDKYNRRGPIK